MIDESKVLLGDLADGVAVLGNSLLKPMTLSSDMYLCPDVWAGFKIFGDVSLDDAAEKMQTYIVTLVENQGGVEPAALATSVEYTKLFVGPKEPAAAPWETMYRPGADENTSGFGQATIEMRRLLQSAGLGLVNQNNQYEDHIGIELLYLSYLIREAFRMGIEADEDCSSEKREAFDVAVQRMKGFAKAYPGSWVSQLATCVSAAKPGGYFEHLLNVAHAVLDYVEKL